MRMYSRKWCAKKEKKKKKLVHQSKWIVKWQGDPRQFKKTSEQLPAE